MTSENQPPAPIVWLKRQDIEAKTKFASSTIYKKMAAGEFPQPVRLGMNCSRWVESEVDAWMHEQQARGKSDGVTTDEE